MSYTYKHKQEISVNIPFFEDTFAPAAIKAFATSVSPDRTAQSKGWYPCWSDLERSVPSSERTSRRVKFPVAAASDTSASLSSSLFPDSSCNKIINNNHFHFHFHHSMAS